MNIYFLIKLIWKIWSYLTYKNCIITYKNIAKSFIYWLLYFFYSLTSLSNALHIFAYCKSHISLLVSFFSEKCIAGDNYYSILKCHLITKCHISWILICSFFESDIKIFFFDLNLRNIYKNKISWLRNCYLKIIFWFR